jgi:hypothetical protein
MLAFVKEIEWKSFLTEYNRELLSYEEVVERLSPELIKAGWLGYAGATDEEISTIEKRLATHLPPSYQAFLKISNGWRFPSVSIFDLLPTSKVSWFREQNQDWIDTYVETSSETQAISDEEYFVYGDKQDCVNFRAEYLQTALQISELGDSAVVLLNPKVVTPDGEWETWFFANWLPGAVRYRSFGDWLSAERLACRKQLKLLSPAQKKNATSKKPRTAKKAAEAACNGQTQVALEALESLATKGDDSATAPLAEFYAFLGQWDKVITNAGRLIANPEAVNRIPEVFTDMVKLLGLAGHHSGDWQRVIDVVEIAARANANRYPGKELEKARDYYEKIFFNLIDYAKRQGKPPHELIAIFPVPNHLKYLIEAKNISSEQREVRYQKAVKIADAISYLKTPSQKAEHVFALIKDVWEDKALELYEAHGTNFLMAWEAALYVACAYIRRGNTHAAWIVIATNLSKWWPVAIVQIAPVILLTDEHLKTLMTPERCQLVLSTPRGPEALKKDK